MFFSTLYFFSLSLCLSCCFETERRYECGTHGRFEYCIDGFPSCVVGCHCHPGYYFDTNTKICEPNIKLQQELRRHYMSEVSHMHSPDDKPIAANLTPAPIPNATTDLDEKVDEIAKDTDDIGDWLYNQFFKTIENQVINKTNNDKPIKLTRRSGNGLPSRKTKKKSRKSWKGSKRKKGKVHGLKRKLLRITEDDSLFDSGSSASTSGESGSSVSDSSDTTSESDGKKDDKDHDHSTILLFNKKPKPPLPSFIFMPQMDTPYYPPIGLPPPPVLPMYPLAPIPPMAPMFPYLAHPEVECTQLNDTATTPAGSTLVAITESLTNTTAPKDSTPEDPAPKDPTPKDPAPKDPAPKDPALKDPGEHPDAAMKEAGEQPDATDPSKPTEPPANTRTNNNRGKKTRKGKSHPNEPNTENIFRTKFNKESRSKLIHKLRENMKNNMPLMDKFIEDEQEKDSPMLNDLTSQEIHSISRKMYLRAKEDRMPEMKDVEFKYLSELIHRANLNDTSKVPSHLVSPNEHMRQMVNIGQTSRRSFQNDNDQQYTQPIANSFKEPRKMQASEADTAFYSKLGRQIATMIRNIDSNGERQVNIEIERTNPTLTQTFFNENRYVPRSYWERSVRSPLQYFKDELEYLNPSNDKLLNLENEVENVANTSPSLSLQDLEDILSTMTKAPFQIQRNMMTDEPKPNINNTSLNINLLPEHKISENDQEILYDAPKQLYKTPKILYSSPKYNQYRGGITPKSNEVNVTESSDTIKTNTFQDNRNVELGVPSDFWWLDMDKPIPVRKPEINQSISKIRSIYDIRPTLRYQTDEISTTVETIQSIPRRHHMEYLKFLNTLSHRPMQQTTKIPNLKYHTQVLNYYFPSSNNDYGHDQSPPKPISYPQQLASYSRAINNNRNQEPIRRPSYSHHELHFDYFK